MVPQLQSFKRPGVSVKGFWTVMKTKFLLLLSLAAASLSVQAIPLVTYSFPNSAGSEASFPADAQPANATASTMTRGTGLTPTAAAGAFSADSWTTAASIDANDYFTFSLNPNAGFSMTLTQLILDERRSGTGIRNWSVRSSLNSFSSDLAVFSVPDDTATRTLQTIDLTAAFTGLTSLLEFRIYGYAAEGPTGTWRIDSVWRETGNASARREFLKRNARECCQRV
jgi:hypothetical protein